MNTGQEAFHQLPTRFLLVEDDDDHVKIFIRYMKMDNSPNSIDRVRDGTEAMAFLRKQGLFANAITPDVILLDLKMPKKDGIEVLDEIKKDEVLRSIPVVILTTSDAESDKIKAYERYANSYLVKPYDPICFEQLVRDLKSYWGTWNRIPYKYKVSQ